MVVDLIAKVVPGGAAGISGGLGAVPASLGLVPTLLGAGPAVGLARVLGNGLSTPVAVLGLAVRGNNALFLSLLDASGLGRWDPDVRTRDRIGAERLVVDVEGISRGPSGPSSMKTWAQPA